MPSAQKWFGEYITYGAQRRRSARTLTWGGTRTRRSDSTPFPQLEERFLTESAAKVTYLSLSLRK